MRLWVFGGKGLSFLLKVMSFCFYLSCAFDFDSFWWFFDMICISIVIICISAIILLYYCFASLYCFTMLSLKLALNVRRPLKVPSLLTNLLSVLLFDFALQIFNSWTLSVCCYASHCVAFRWRGNWKEKIFVINDALFLC